MMIGLLIFGILLGLYVGYCILMPEWRVPSDFKYDVPEEDIYLGYCTIRPLPSKQLGECNQTYQT